MGQTPLIMGPTRPIMGLFPVPGPIPGGGIEARFHRFFSPRKVDFLPSGRPGALVPPLERPRNRFQAPQTGHMTHNRP